MKRRDVGSLVKETKIQILTVIKLLRSDERYLMSKIIDLLIKVDVEYQRELICYMAKFTGVKIWNEMSEDTTLYVDVFRSLLFYFTGRKDLRQPSRDDLIKLLADFARSEEFEKVYEIEKLDMRTALSAI